MLEDLGFSVPFKIPSGARQGLGCRVEGLREVPNYGFRI